MKFRVTESKGSIIELHFPRMQMESFDGTLLSARTFKYLRFQRRCEEAFKIAHSWEEEKKSPTESKGICGVEVEC